MDFFQINMVKYNFYANAMCLLSMIGQYFKDNKINNNLKINGVSGMMINTFLLREENNIACGIHRYIQVDVKFNLTLKRKTHDKKITPIFYSSDKKYKTLHLKYNCCPVAIYCDIIYPENPRAAVNIHNKCNIGCPNEIVLERPKKCGAYSV